jgi:hypothetical protein
MLEAIITVTGLMITAYFSIKQFKKTNIALSDIEVYNFEKENYEKFKNLKITLNDVEINNKLTFIKGVIYIAGQNDIPKESIHQGITIKGDNDTVFKDFKILKSNYDFKIANSGGAISVISDILKVNDYIIFETVCENLNSELKIEHRILNAADTLRIRYSSLKDSRPNSIFLLILGILMLFVLAQPFMSLRKQYDFETIFYENGEQISKESLENNRKNFIEGWNNGIEAVKKGIDSLAQDSLLPDDSRIRLLPLRLELFKKFRGNTDISLYEDKIKAGNILDSIIRNTNSIEFFWAKEYKKRFKIGNSLEASFRLENYTSIVINLIFIITTLIFILPGILYLYIHLKFEVPLKRILGQEEVTKR